RLTGDVRISLFYSSQAGALRREMSDLLALYQEAQPRITVRAFDLDRSPGMAKRLGVGPYNPAVGQAREANQAGELAEREAVTPPSVAALVRRFGVELAGDLVVDERARLFGTDGLSARVAYLNQGLVPDAPEMQALLPEAQSLRVIDAPGVRADYLATTAEGAWADVDRRADGAVFRPGHDRRGPLPIATFTRVRAAGGREGRLVV